jgi:hypothetical protein
MDGLLITSKDKSELTLLAELAKKIGINVKMLSEDEILDIGLLTAMEVGRKSKPVPKSEILKKLNK